MAQQISMREANQHLSRYVQWVEEGHEVVLTRRGKPVARLVPVEQEKSLTEEQAAALERTRKRMNSGYDLGGVFPDRDELHAR